MQQLIIILDAWEGNIISLILLGDFLIFMGEGQQLYRVIPRAILSCLTGKKFILDGKGASKRFFIHSKDIVNSIKLLLFNSDNFTEYNFSGNEEISISDLIYLICQITNVDYKEIVEFGPERAGKDMFYRLDCQKAMTELMWKPKVNLREGIEKTVEWIVRNLDKLSKRELELYPQELISLKVVIEYLYEKFLS